MSKNKIFIIIVFLLVLVEGIGFVYFAYKSAKLGNNSELLNERIKKLAEDKEEFSHNKTEMEKMLEVLAKKLEDKDVKYTKDLKDKPKIEKENKDLLEKYERIKKDRENILIQAKRLIQENNELKELEKSFKESKKLVEENNKFKEELASMAIKAKGIKISSMIFSDECNKDDEGIGRKLREEFSRLQKGYSILGSSLIRSSRKTDEKRLADNEEELKDLEIDKPSNDKTENEISEKFYSPLRREFKKFKGVVAELKKEKIKAKEETNKLKLEMNKLLKEKYKAEQIIEEEKEKTKKMISSLKKIKVKYKKAVKANKAFYKKTKEVPKKFSVIVRQNAMLLKETARMHYNLGVFFTKNREYEKAIVEYKKAIEIRPDDANSYFNLGYVYAERFDDREKAIESFRSFLRLAESDDKDINWVKKYLFTWETFKGKRVIK